MKHDNTSVAITGFGVISPIGIGAQEFTTGILEGRSGLKPINGVCASPLPFDQACVIPEFEVKTYLGKKGTQSMDRTTGLAVAASGMALQHSGVAITPANETRSGVVLGTSTGSMRSISTFTKETFVQHPPYLVSATEFPNTVMNCAAGQCAIWHNLKGINATVSGGRLSSLLALRYALLKLRLGYTDLVLAGGVEEFSEHTAWAFHHVMQGMRSEILPIGEGCVMLVLEKSAAAKCAGRSVRAEMLACEIQMYPLAQQPNCGQLTEGLTSCIQTALDSAGVSPRDVWGVSLQGCGGELGDPETRALTTILKDNTGVQYVGISPLVGETYSAAGVFQIAAALARLSHSTAHDRVVLVTSFSRGGSVGCAVLRG